jgi:hypothetical protein
LPDHHPARYKVDGNTDYTLAQAKPIW